MRQFFFEAFCKQFPFLTSGDKPFVTRENIEKATVSRIDPELLAYTPTYSGATGSLVGIDDDERIYLLDKDGFLLVQVKQSVDVVHNEAHSDNEYEDGETVGEALLRLEDPNEVVYALKVHTGYEIRDHHSAGGYEVVVYKAPKGFTLKEWVDEQLRRADAQLQATIAEIDAEPRTV